MEKITYKAASKLLNKHYDTIKLAVERGSLTKCISRTERASLLKEQVLLFEGKTQISTRALNPQELKKWEEYKEIAESYFPEKSSEPQKVYIVIPGTLSDLWDGAKNGIYTITLNKKYTNEELRKIMLPLA